MAKQIPLVTDTSEGGVSGDEELVNLYPVKTSGNKYPFVIKHTPGLAFYLDLPTLPVKAMIAINGRGFAVTSTKFYEIFKDGTSKELGDVVIDGIASIDHNGVHIVVVDGIKGYYCEISTGTVAEITAAGFYPAKTVTAQDGYFIFDRTDTGQFFLSELLNVTFDPLDFATAEGRPDKLVAVLSDHREVFMFGTESIEVWYNSGAADFPFERNQGAFIEKGCSARYSITKQNNTVYFVGSDGMVYQLNGYTPLRISNNAVEQSLAGINHEDITAYVYNENGQLFYNLTIPDRKVTWSYAVASGSWHRRENKQFGRGIAGCAMKFDGKNLIGDHQSGRIFVMADNWHLEDGYALVRSMTLPTITMGRKNFSISSLELDITSGIGTVNGQGQDPIAMLEVSKDGGKTWSHKREARMGKRGEHSLRLKWNKLGMGREFTFRITISDPVAIDIGGAWIEVS